MTILYSEANEEMCDRNENTTLNDDEDDEGIILIAYGKWYIENLW